MVRQSAACLACAHRKLKWLEQDLQGGKEPVCGWKEGDLAGFPSIHTTTQSKSDHSMDLCLRLGSIYLLGYTYMRTCVLCLGIKTKESRRRDEEYGIILQ